jgi:hypothetical protein
MSSAVFALKITLETTAQKFATMDLSKMALVGVSLISIETLVKHFVKLTKLAMENAMTMEFVYAKKDIKEKVVTLKLELSSIISI